MASTPKLTPAEIVASRESLRQYEANMAIEGMVLTDYERQFVEQLIDQGVGYKEIIKRTMADLQARGVIPAHVEIAK